MEGDILTVSDSVTVSMADADAQVIADITQNAVHELNEGGAIVDTAKAKKSSFSFRLNYNAGWKITSLKAAA